MCHSVVCSLTGSKGLTTLQTDSRCSKQQLNAVQHALTLFHWLQEPSPPQRLFVRGFAFRTRIALQGIFVPIGPTRPEGGAVRLVHVGGQGLGLVFVSHAIYVE